MHPTTSRRAHKRRSAHAAAQLAFTSATLIAAGAASAQTAAAPADEPTRVVVTGLRASLESALNKKREDNGIVDVIKAEDMGKFPDTNLAESLQRVPGVTINRDAGEGRNITVRGLGQDFTRVRINGIEGLATTGGTDSSGGANRSRGFDFNVFASELFSSLTVRKSSSADVDEGSLGATVDLTTMRPFDLKGFNATITAKGKYNDLSEKTDPRVAFLLSNTFMDRKVGVLLSGAYSKRRVLEEGFSTVRWDNGPSAGGWCAPMGVANNPANSTATTCGPAAQGVARLPFSQGAVDAYNAASAAGNYTPRIPRYGRLTHDQDRLGLTGSVQWRPMRGSLLTFDMLYSKLEASRAEDYLEAISFSRSASQGGKPQTSVVEAQYAANGALQYGVFNGVDIRAESRYDELTTTFTQPTLTWEQDLAEGWRLNAKVGRAKSKFRNPVQTTTTLDALNVNGYTMDFRNNDRLPVIGYPFDPAQAGGPLTIVGVPQVASGTQPSSVPNTTPSEIRIRPQGTTNTTDVADVNVAWDALPDRLSLKMGASAKKYKFDSYEFRRVNQGDTIFAPPAGTSVASLTSTLTGFGGGMNLPAGTPTSWAMPNLAAIAQAYDIYCNCIKSGPAGGPGDFTLSSIENPNARGNNRSVTEEDKGVYLMGDFNTELGGIPIRGNVGVRYVRTDLSSTGYVAANNGTAVTVDHRYSDTLPAFNVAATLRPDFVVRFGAAKVMTRPQLNDLSPGGTIATTGSLAITSGNPNLKPFRAKTFDSSFEWYFARNAFLGLGLFQKNIDTYIQSLRTDVRFRDTGLPQSLLPTNFTGDEVFSVTAPVNTDGGKLRGFEINYQQPFTFLPGIGKNFGTLLNYTYVKSTMEYIISPTANTTITDDLLNLSPKSWNATFYYDDGRFSARLSTSQRDAYLTRVPGQNNNDVEGRNKSMNVDLSLSYKVNDKLELTLEGVNLTDEENDQFTSRQRNSVVVNHVTGREFLLGLRYKF
ncbi:TonB-dependent receptor [Pseudoduganella plicata]|uniref:TonB-dependent receptor n=1 Tax=Pseudoduganella plicata TaxID=321984 RepID=A0A4P7BJQ8_9BURK|nr:TonB-dependent receptor [Pseudoduganella plicata]QBQ38502.1 TonB-dependent receptor [Pseudoduganella plicata]GGY82557.1 TonB-dependent receptor [Pseudoduganella plicata]